MCRYAQVKIKPHYFIWYLLLILALGVLDCSIEDGALVFLLVALSSYNTGNSI